MTARQSDRLLAGVLIIVSALWCWGVAQTIPVFDESRLGARGFPLGLGILLAALGLIILLQSFSGREADDNLVTDEDQSNRRPAPRTELWAVGVGVLLPISYALLLERTGFLIATFVITAVAVGPVLRLWRPKLILGMALGMSLGIYLIFGKLLGVYLPRGSWLDLAF